METDKEVKVQSVVQRAVAVGAQFKLRQLSAEEKYFRGSAEFNLMLDPCSDDGLQSPGELN